MNIGLNFSYCQVKEISSSSGFTQDAPFIIGIEGDEIIGFHIDIVKIRTSSGQGMCDVIVDIRIVAGFLVRFFQTSVIFLFIIGYTDNDLLTVIFFNYCRFQCRWSQFSAKQEAVIVDKVTLLFYF